MTHNHTFAGLQIAKTNLIFKNNAFAFAKDWKENSYGKIYGKKEGSTYFNWEEAKNVNVDGWRVPTKEEWAAIVSTEREGSVYNGQEHACFALVQVNVPFGERTVCNGLLLFPDGATINGVEIEIFNKTWINNNYYLTQSVTKEQLNDLLAQGCAFLPASGYYLDGLDWQHYGGLSGCYWSSTELGEDDGYMLYFIDVNLDPESNAVNKEDDYDSVRLVRE